jgi:ABC-type polysaccharide/polyol phosphate transport system ATPase subunit
MNDNAVEIVDVSKRFRLYHEKNQYLKSTLLSGRRSRFEDFWALDDISFEIPRGSTFGIIGANGSGKSTLLKCLTGILTPDKGKIHTVGRIAALLELGAGFHPDLTGRENVFLNAAILGMTKNEIISKFDSIVDFAGLANFLDTPVKNYSSGMVVRLGFAIAINVEPDILIIDEVLAVGDESFQQRCYEKIETFRQSGRTIIFVSHALTQVTQLCETACWIEGGKIRRLGPAYSVVSDYTGESHNAIDHAADEIGERWGTGEVQIKNVELQDHLGNPSRVFRSGQSMRIKIDTSTTNDIYDAVCGVRITHLHGFNVWGSNTKRRGEKLPTLRGQNSIEITIDELPILEGTYDLTVAVSDMSETHAYDHWEKKIRFEVRQFNTFDEGILNISPTWKFYNS